jgi:multidrug efflux pump subunit AcrB/ABC-type multidrug transport system ATPase subunit
MTSLIDRKILVSMLFLALTMLGVVSYRQLQVELLPNTELPVLYVRIQAPAETDPRFVEQIAVIPMEGVIGTLENVESIETRVMPGSANIMVSLTQHADITISYLKLVEKIKKASSQLPDGFSASVIKIDMNQVTNQFMRVQVRGHGGADRVRNIVEQEIRDRFANISGIAAVEVYGGRENSVEILVNEQLAEGYGITLGQIRQRIAGQQSAKAFAGLVKDGFEELFVTIEADYNSLEELENIVLKNEGPIRLKDVASVNFGVKEEDSFSRINGMEAVTVTLARESQVNLIDLAKKVEVEMTAINAEYESLGIETIVEFNSAETMQSNIDSIISLALIGGLLALFLLWVFLKNIYLVFVAMIAIPVSVYSAFNFFYGAGVSINILTLVGLALAIGMLIDNNVVVMENIHRLAASGNSLRKSVIDGTKQVWRSVTASTFTTITVFLPFVFSSNMMFREVAKHISVSIVATLLISLITALILVPVLTLAFLRNTKRLSSSGFTYLNLHNRMVQLYLQLLKACLRRPAVVIISAVVLLFASVFLSLAVSVNTSQEAETASFYISVEMPTGATLETTDAVVRELETRLSNIPENPDIIVQVYAETASITVRLPEDYPNSGYRTIGEIRRDLQGRIINYHNASVTLSQSLETGNSRGMGGGGAGMGGMDMAGLFGIGAQTEKVVIRGEDFDKMLLVADDVKYYLEENLENINSVFISTTSARPEVHLGFDPLLMGLSGVSPANISQELSTFRNEIPSGGTFKLANETYDISIKTSDTQDVERETKGMDDLVALQIETSTGGMVPLRKVSSINYARGRSEMRRANQGKIIEVVYRFTEDVNASKTLLESSRAEVQNLVDLIPLPADVAVTVVHEENPFDEFKFLILIAILLIYMILASVFGSFSSPFVMMFTVPLAAIGSLLALTLTGSSLLSLNTLIGFLILLGVVVNNGIILMDYANQLRRGGATHLRALMQAGISRIRPVTITAATTIIAMLPLAMGKAEYVGSLGAPFAITVIGGLSLSTILTLVFVPTFAYGLESAIVWVRTQNQYLVAAMVLTWGTGLWLILGVSDASLIWQLAYLILLVAGVPALAWFVTNSLRQAKGAGIRKDDAITITVRNLVKIYERPTRFVREWRSRQQAINRSPEDMTVQKAALELIWQIPLIAFCIYFIWFYSTGGLTLFIGTLLFYLCLPLFFTTGSGMMLVKALPSNRAVRFTKRYLPPLYRFGFPLLAGINLHLRWDSTTGVIFILVAWYAILTLLHSGENLRKGIVNIPMEKGKWNSIKRWIWITIRQLPLIGERKEPFKALKGVSLEFKTGMIGLLGPNGAGKTTLMRTICGVLDQSYGKIFINGVDTNDKREELQGLIGYLPQEFGMYENMTARGFLDYMALLKGISNPEERFERIEYVLKAVHMWDRRNEKIGAYSGGMKQRIGIAMILLHLPRILVVDEPTAGLDPSERIRFRNLLVELSRERVVIFSTHIIEDISSSCNQVAVMFRGELKYWGTPVRMSEFAQGKVWQAEIPESDFEKANQKHRIVHHVKTGDHIRIRCLSENKPFETAIPLKPLLEDAYLLMLQANKE